MSYIEEQYEIAQRRAAGRCEWSTSIGHKLERCDEQHGMPAKHYKGKCILLPHLKNKKNITADNIMYVCLKHGNEMDAVKHKRASQGRQPKETDPNQIRMFS